MGRLVVPVSVLAVVLVAGCGGGGSKLTHTQFVSKANAICADYNARTAKLAAPNSFDSVVTYASQLRKIAEDDVGKFEKLNPPDEDRANWKAFGKSGDQLIAAAGDLEKAAKDRDAAKIQQLLDEAKTRSAESKRIGTAMGTPACAQT